jgi:transposase
MLWSIRYRLLCGLLRLLVRCGVDERDLEAVVLRCQLKILRRHGGRRPRFTTADRAFLAAAARLLSRDRWRSFLVGPDTLLRWHRELLRRRRRGPSRRPGRPSLDSSIKELIRRLGRENPRWGYLRIRGELLKLGVDVSHTTVATVLRQSGLGPAPRRIGPTWTQFLRLQAYGLLSDSSRSDQDDDPEDVTSGPPEALTPVGEDPATAEHEESVHDDPSAPSPRILVTVHARRRACVTVVPPGVGVRARDGPAIAA